MGTQRPDFAEFYRGSRDDCLRTVLVSVGNRDTAQDLVDGDETGLLGKVFSQPLGQVNSAVIRPSAIPRGAGVQISPVINGGQVPAIAVGIVDASPQCTGS
ncbi:MAG TPA: hypothetical protein VGR98_11745 [Streptosporangiaceae bacterium]|nr:hypothetical protein [Streptosporangiaceae bacterium]